MSLPLASSGSSSTATRGAAPRCAIWFAIRDDLKYLSHQDEARVLERAMRRAGWPLKHSEGFNPKPYVSLPLPRPVGVASDCEWAWVELMEVVSPRELYERLAPTMPANAPLSQVHCPVPAAAPQATRVVYEAALPCPPADLSARIEALLAETRLLIQRDHGPHKPARPVDLRPFIESLTLDKGVLRCGLLVDRQQTARLAEILKALDLPSDALQPHARRVRVEWNIEARPANAWPPLERNNLGHEENCEETPRFGQP